ncbi:hypothetical protein KDA23_06805 [Candidatus Saccharibacteria bacterium]|nr:hypothetical protein [Candidatus Saccharibacteria bacterium]
MSSQTPEYIPAPIDRRSKVEKWADEALRMVKRLDTDELAKAEMPDCVKVGAVVAALQNKIDEATRKKLVLRGLA